MRLPIDLNGLDTLVQLPLRVGLVTALQLDGPRDLFTRTKPLEAADGSLTRQHWKPVAAEYICVEGAFAGRRLKTIDPLSWKERAVLSRHLDTLDHRLVKMRQTFGTG